MSFTAESPFSPDYQALPVPNNYYSWQQEAHKTTVQGPNSQMHPNGVGEKHTCTSLLQRVPQSEGDPAIRSLHAAP